MKKEELVTLPSVFYFSRKKTFIVLLLCIVLFKLCYEAIEPCINLLNEDIETNDYSNIIKSYIFIFLLYAGIIIFSFMSILALYNLFIPRIIFTISQEGIGIPRGILRTSLSSLFLIKWDNIDYFELCIKTYKKPVTEKLIIIHSRNSEIEFYQKMDFSKKIFIYLNKNFVNALFFIPYCKSSVKYDIDQLINSLNYYHKKYSTKENIFFGNPGKSNILEK